MSSPFPNTVHHCSYRANVNQAGNSKCCLEFCRLFRQNKIKASVKVNLFSDIILMSVLYSDSLNISMSLGNSTKLTLPVTVYGHTC